ncbi:Guanosine-3',5'-bis(diphosphate) 3'-pyrophosphohydrolase MESH1 [Podochytrium sp. JEL0797]|nr:Guanosine-3',5'-bis(diphosphate) 3'-pyrophosphohydrolase MESH1 [Podochytrium sp. JEL0797]
MNSATELLSAIHFAALKHSTQRRKDPAQTPYINHPIGVAHILSTEAHDSDLATLIAAILHDTVEDTETTLDEIESVFGKEVRDIVAEVTDDTSLEKAERKRRQIEKAPFASRKAKMVKMADKIYNLRSLEVDAPMGWAQERVDAYFVWAKAVTDGLKGVNEPMESILEKLYRDHEAKKSLKGL